MAAYNRTEFIEERRGMMKRWTDYRDSLLEKAREFHKHYSENSWKEKNGRGKTTNCYSTASTGAGAISHQQKLMVAGLQDQQISQTNKNGPGTTVWRKDEIEERAEKIF